MKIGEIQSWAPEVYDETINVILDKFKEPETNPRMLFNLSVYDFQGSMITNVTGSYVTAITALKEAMAYLAPRMNPDLHLPPCRIEVRCVGELI